MRSVFSLALLDHYDSLKPGVLPGLQHRHDVDELVTVRAHGVAGPR